MMNRYWEKNFNFHIHYLHVITSVGGGLVRFSFYWRQKLTDIHNTVFILYTTKKTNTKTGEVRILTIKVYVGNLYAFKPKTLKFLRYQTFLKNILHLLQF